LTAPNGREGAATHSSYLLETAFAFAPVPIALIGPGGEPLRINDSLRNLLNGGDECMPALDRRLVACINGTFGEIKDRFVSGDLNKYETERLTVLPDGTEKWLHITAGAVRSVDKTLDHIVAHVQDVDERKRHERQMRENLIELSVEAQIRSALDEEAFVLHAQPITDLSTGETFAQELLLRMRDSSGRLVGPQSFLAVAERTGLIVRIDRWVIERGIEQAAAGRRVEINVSGRSLGNPSLDMFVAGALARHGADPSRVVFEVTETAVIENLDVARRFAERVAQLGCGLALDDFGTGFGTLTAAKALPVSLVKIDIEFIRDVLTDARSESIVRSVINFARGLQAKTVAEGVEDEQTLDKLRELGVDYAQGYLIGRPGPLEWGS
jgi:EAL domain-containing protein (putative c-di-GMP-specific phosphodiesterase class I)